MRGLHSKRKKLAIILNVLRGTRDLLDERAKGFQKNAQVIRRNSLKVGRAMQGTSQATRTSHDERDDARERALIARIATGDKQAFSDLFAQYGERVFRYAYRLISSASKAEEVTNDVMLEVWKNAGRFEGRSKVSTWILGITRNLALNAIRRKEFDTVDIEHAPEIADPEPISEVVDRDRRKLQRSLQRALGKLSTEHRDVVELTFFHGCSYAEIAAIVDCPENTVKTRMYHAKKQLQGLLVEAGVDLNSLEIAS
jgi:RNA polymerase sigma-70 factor (ECF subfamily)